MFHAVLGAASDREAGGQPQYGVPAAVVPVTHARPAVPPGPYAFFHRGTGVAF